ncbi:MAG: metal ABC transporter permease [Ruminococcus sp.]|jgi:zinc transport system permease protein|nr:metal ABC transporter permease [Ruminococcus sp.]
MHNFLTLLTPELWNYVILPALIGGIAVAVCAALLGVTLVLRRYSMIGDGLSHVGYGTLCVASVMNLAPLYVAIPVVLFAAFLLFWLSESGKIKGDYAIALFSTTAMSIGILVSSKAGLTNDVSHYMFGSILALNTGDVVLCVITAVIVIAAFIFLYHRIFTVTFDRNFSKATGIPVTVYNMVIAGLIAITVVMGMMLMGTLLISSLIVVPTLSAMQLCRSFRGVVISAVCISVGCFIAGFFTAIAFDFTPGATVVVVNVVFYLICCLLGKVRKAE